MSALITGSAIAQAQTVTLPAHNVGDLIVMFGYRQSATAVGVPSAGGTVPAWVTIDSSANVGSSTVSLITAWFVAVATNHASGTWVNTGTNAGLLAAVVISGADPSAPVGGHASASSATSATAVTAPSVTMTKSDGTSLLLHFFTHAQVTAWASPASGYTNVNTSTGTAGGKLCINTKTDTTSDGSVAQSITSTSNTVGQAATVEILAAVPAVQGNFFALF